MDKSQDDKSQDIDVRKKLQESVDTIKRLLPIRKRYHVIDWTLFVVPILALCAFIFLYIVPMHKDLRESKREIEKSTAELLEMRRDAMKAQIANPKDSANMHLRSLEIEVAQLRDDMRQDRDNAIDNMNLWLAFWLAVLTVFCGILPIFLQYRFFYTSRDAIRKELDRYRRYTEGMHLHSQSHCIDIVSRRNVVIDNAIREKMLQKEIVDTARTFRDLVTAVSESDSSVMSPESYNQICEGLLQLLAMIDSVHILVSHAYQRDFWNIHDEIMVMLSRFYENPMPHNEAGLGIKKTYWIEIRELQHLADRVASISCMLEYRNDTSE